MKILIIVNDGPYGTERAYNAFRLTNQLNKDHEKVEVRIFLMADAVTCALANQTTATGFYNIERMLKLAIIKGAKVKICGSCAEARGLKHAQLIDGAEMSSMAELATWVIDSEKTLVF
ncbi:MAG: DsrE family protein [Cyclobacteriaceae bacterium]